MIRREGSAQTTNQRSREMGFFGAPFPYGDTQALDATGLVPHFCRQVTERRK